MKVIKGEGVDPQLTQSKDPPNIIIICNTILFFTKILYTGVMDLIQNGWFSEVSTMWPGQAMSLKVEEVPYTRLYTSYFGVARWLPPRLI